MTDTIEETHVSTALALLTGNPALGPTRVFDSLVPNPTVDPNTGFVLVYSRVAWPRDGLGTGLDAIQDTVTTTLTCHCAGSTVKAARVIGMQVRSSLLGVRPVIAGRICGLIKTANNPDPPVRDESLGFPVFDLILEYDFTTTA
jgi:hypothetical protein